MTAFPNNALVKLTDRYARALSKTAKRGTDWESRRGIVVRCNDHEVYVAWPGRTTPEQIPIKAVELAK